MIPATRFRVAARLCGALLLVSGISATPDAQVAKQPTAHFADAGDVQSVTAGKAVYMQRCAGCHGKRLQGQALWQIEDQYSRRRAPAQDESGHSWQHSDEELFQKTRSGRFGFESPDEASAMPAFAQTLSDAEILHVIAFIKARWPLGMRVSQAMLNPGYAGMPADADKVEWTLPPNCRTTTVGWRSQSP